MAVCGRSRKAALWEVFMMRAILVCLGTLVVVACAVGNSTHSVRTAARIPVYSCVDTRIKQAKECRARAGIANPSVLVRSPGNAAAVPGPR